MYLVFCILNTVCIHVWGYIENSILIIYQRSTKTWSTTCNTTSQSTIEKGVSINPHWGGQLYIQKWMCGNLPWLLQRGMTISWWLHDRTSHLAGPETKSRYSVVNLSIFHIFTLRRSIHHSSFPTCKWATTSWSSSTVSIKVQPPSTFKILFSSLGETKLG